MNVFPFFCFPKKSNEALYYKNFMMKFSFYFIVD